MLGSVSKGLDFLRRAGTKNLGYFMRNRELVRNRGAQVPYDSKANVSAETRATRPVYEITLEEDGSHRKCTFHFEIANDIVPGLHEHFNKLASEPFPRGYIGSKIDRLRPGVSIQFGNLHAPLAEHLQSMHREANNNTNTNNTNSSNININADDVPAPLLRAESRTLRHSERGVVTLLEVLPNAVSTQAAVTLADSMPHMDGRIGVPIGKVLSGVNSLEAYVSETRHSKGVPVSDVRITAVVQVKGDAAEAVRGQIMRERERIEQLEREKKEKVLEKEFDSLFPPMKVKKARKKKQDKK